MKRMILDIFFILIFILINAFLFKIEWRLFKETPHYHKLKRKWQYFKIKKVG